MVFPSGAEVSATSYGRHVTISAKVPGVDKDNTKGQCGNNNGQSGDDFEGKSEAAFLNSLRYKLFEWKS